MLSTPSDRDDILRTESDQSDSLAEPAVSWDYSTDADLLSGALVLAATGLLAGVLVGPLLLVVVIAVTSAVAGDRTLLAVLLAVAAAGVVANRAEVVAMRTVDHGAIGHGYGRVGLAVALLGGGAVHIVAAVTTGGVLVNGALIVLGIALLLVAGVLVGEGCVDPSAGTVEYDGADLPIDSIRSIHPLELGDRAVVLVRYERGVPRASRLPTFSSTAFDAAEPLLRGSGSESSEGGADASSGGQNERDGSTGVPRAVRTTAGVMGIGTLALAVGLYALAPADVRPVVAVIAVTTLPVTAAFCWYAYAG